MLPFFHTAPAGRPAALVGMFIIDKLFTKVVFILFAVMKLPTIIAQANVLVVLFPPPRIALLVVLAVFVVPPPIKEQLPDAVFELPATIVE